MGGGAVQCWQAAYGTSNKSPPQAAGAYAPPVLGREQQYGVGVGGNSAGAVAGGSARPAAAAGVDAPGATLEVTHGYGVMHTLLPVTLVTTANNTVTATQQKHWESLLLAPHTVRHQQAADMLSEGDCP